MWFLNNISNVNLNKMEKTFRVIGEHGNQVEPGSAFPDFKMATESSLAYHLNEILIDKVLTDSGDHKKRPKWVQDADNVDNDVVIFWIFSKYFYHELGPIIKLILTPMLILFSFAVPYFIFDVVTEFFIHPKWLQPLLLFLETNTLMKTIIFILYFDMVIILIIFVITLLKKGFYKRLKGYGIDKLSDIIISKEIAYAKHAKDVIAGKNDFNEKSDFYVNGHTHTAGIFTDEHTNITFADSGSWKMLMKKLNTRFRFPSVFVPYFQLSYLVFEVENEKIRVQLRNWPKNFKPKLTFFEKLAVKDKEKIPQPVMEDTLIKEVKFDFK